MLLPEELYTFVPRRVASWTSQDVQQWFRVNKIEIKSTFGFEQQRFDGLAFQAVTPEYLVKQCGIGSKIVMKKIMEWIEHDREQFDQYVDMKRDEILQERNETERGSKVGYSDNQFQEPNKENTPKNQPLEEINSKHNQAIIPLQNVKQWNISKKRKHLSVQNKVQQSFLSKQIYQKRRSFNTQKQTPNYVKFVESSYQVCEQFLHFQYQIQQTKQKKVINLGGGGVIGRHNCEVLILQQSVSRQHAEIIKMQSQYFLRDNGSKFGTYVQIGKDSRKPLQVGDVLDFYEFQIQLIKLKVNNKKGFRSFDLQVKIFKGKEVTMNFFNKCFVFIGRKDKDITFKSPLISLNHAKIVLENDNRVYLVKQQGQTFIKLKSQEIYKLQLQAQKIRFGLQEVMVSVVKQKRPIVNISEFYPYKC